MSLHPSCTTRAGRVGVLLTSAAYAAAMLLTAGTAPAVAAPTSSTIAAAEEGGPASLELVLDASGSMKKPSGDGRTRFKAGVSALTSVVRTLPDDLAVGLRIYGSEIADGPGSCKDSRLVVPVGPTDEPALTRALRKARAQGNTPLAFSLLEAAKDLPEGGQRSIVLVSDGEESCGGDPCAVARDLTKQGVDLHVDVVGFQVGTAARNQLTCIAQAGRGTFYDARDARDLTAQLSRISARAARAYAPVGIPVEGTPSVDGAPSLTPGAYLDTIGDGDDVETYALSPEPGHGVDVGATIRPTGVALADSERVTVTVTSAEGTDCDSATESGQIAFDSTTPVAAAVLLSGEDLTDCGSAPYAVQVERKGGTQVVPLEVTYVDEPPLEDTSGLPAAVTDVKAQSPKRAPGGTQALGAPSFSAAPILEPGTYTDAMLLRETLVWGVTLDWGQQLTCRVDFGRSKTVARDIDSTVYAESRLYGPLHPELSDSGQQSTAQQQYDGRSLVSAYRAAPPVRYLNRESGSVEGASLPGTYYCAALARVAGEQPQVGEIPVTVTLAVTGTAGEGAPAYAAGEPSTTQSQSPEASPSAAADESKDDAAAPPSSSDEGGFPWWGWLIAFLVVDTAVLAYVLVKRRAARDAG